MSARYSVRNWTNDNIPTNLLMQHLKNGYGYFNGHRSLPLIGGDYSLQLYVANATGTYRYNPEQNTLTVHNLNVNKETLRPRFYQGFPSDANAIIIIVWNQTKMNNGNFASAEAGLLAQNMYLSAVDNGLGTVCVGEINSAGLRSDLGLENTMTPLLVMPIGYPFGPYPSATPDYTKMAGNLPTVQIGPRSFTDALGNLLYAKAWNTQDLSLQELSQLLWAAYGYTSTGHRTVPSAGPTYSLRIYVANATAVYQYVPGNHSVVLIVNGDRRLDIAEACGDQTWLAAAPAVFVVAWDISIGWDGGSIPHEYPEADTGVVIQSLLLEASAWNLSGSVVSQGLEEWNGAGATSIRNLLGLPSTMIPLYTVPVGHGGVIPEFPNFQVIAVFFVATTGVAIFYIAACRRPRIEHKQ